MIENGSDVRIINSTDKSLNGIKGRFCNNTNDLSACLGKNIGPDEKCFAVIVDGGAYISGTDMDIAVLKFDVEECL